jgi:peptidyl-Asp metalloendopeptidase
MKSIRNSLVTLIACVVAMPGAGHAEAGATQKLFATQTVAADVTLPPHAKGTGWVAGFLNARVLDAPTLEIPLPDGQVLVALQTHVSNDSRLDTRTWTGRIVGYPGDLVSLAQRHGTIAGFLNSAGRTFEILPIVSDQHVLFEVKSQRMPISDAVRAPIVSSKGKSLFGDSVVGSLSATVCPVVHDLLVLYTPESAAARSSSALESLIVAAVEAANASYRQSKVNITLSLVGLRMIGITEGINMPETLYVLSCDAGCMDSRNSLGADIALLVTERNDNDWCGYAYIMDSNSTQFAPFAYAVVWSHCLSSTALTHEIGHVQGVAHDRETGGNPGAFLYAHGYRRCTPDGVAFHDIMAYRCTNTTSDSLTTFASPDIYYHGYPTGISYELDPVNSADAVRTLNETGPTVASFRATGMTAPSAPASLTAAMTSAGSVNLAWTDRADDEAGFKIERTTDGVNYVETARLSANVDRYQDLTTNSMTVYSYRVAAYNSAGQSPYSNVATVKPATTGGGSGDHSGSGGGSVDMWLVITGLMLAVAHRGATARRITQGAQSGIAGD